MINYIKSEIYKVTRNKMTYMYLGAIIILEAVMSILIKIYDINMGKNFDTAFLLEAIRINAFNVPLYLTFMITSLVFAEEYKNRTMTNSISFGFNRAQIYFSKFIVQILTALVFAVIAFAGLIGISWLILGFNGDMSESLNIFFSRTFAAFPIWLGGLAIANALAFIFTSTMAFSTIFMTVVLIIPTIFDTIALFTDKLDFIKNNLLSCQLSATSYLMKDLNTTSADIRHFYFLGAIYLVAAIIIGYCAFRKKEIK